MKAMRRVAVMSFVTVVCLTMTAVAAAQYAPPMPAMPASDLKYDFGDGAVKAGYTHVSATPISTEDAGYGFEPFAENIVPATAVDGCRRATSM